MHFFVGAAYVRRSLDSGRLRVSVFLGAGQFVGWLSAGMKRSNITAKASDFQ
jgi:hypothetical protein